MANRNKLAGRNKLVKGKEWTKSKINDLLKMIRPSQLEQIVNNYWEYIPEGEYSDLEKIGFIVCAMPNAANLPKQFVLEQLLTGPLNGPNQRDVYYAKPNIVKGMREMDEEHCLDELISLFREHKRCPDFIKNNDDWVLIVALAEVIDRYYTFNTKEATHLDLLNSCKQHIEYIKEFNRVYGK